MIRIAAIGDLHADEATAEHWGLALRRCSDDADLLLLAGDLTQRGTPAEGDALAKALADLSLPAVAVLGNHDVDRGAGDHISAALQAVGVVVLAGQGASVETANGRVGVAGTKGFGGGFDDARASDFGEPEMKAFVAAARREAELLARSLERIAAPRVALLHYAPAPDTLVGEAPAVVPFLGSQLLEDVIDRAGVLLVIHGHAHAGRERGRTRGGVPVRNVARPVIGRAYRVYCLPGGEECASSAPRGPAPAAPAPGAPPAPRHRAASDPS